MFQGEGGATAVDGIIEADQVADALVAALEEGKVLVLPHPEVKVYMQRKASDYERWIKGMQRLRRRYDAGKDSSSQPIR
jgi:hypothetical protein